MEDERMVILKMLEDGRIDADGAATLLAALETATEESSEEVPERADEIFDAPKPAPEGPPTNWARFWIYPMMGGLVVLILGALVVAIVSSSGGGAGWTLCCGWLPLLAGLTVVILAVWTRNAKWMHLRITEEGGRKIAFSFPLPLTFTAWVLRIIQPFVPELADTGVDELILAMRDSATGDEPIVIDVQDDEGGERVQVYIG
jgi:hypothetical protein